MGFTEQEIEEFKTEATEMLDAAEHGLLGLDRGGKFKDIYDTVFRAFHNLKGGAAMMELEQLQHHTHQLEDALVAFKDHDEISKEKVSWFLRGIDAARMILENKEVNFDYGNSQSNAAVEHAEPAAKPLSEVGEQPKLSSVAIDEFIAECDTISENIFSRLRQLESKELCKDDLHALYRDIHSLKGSAYLFGFAALGDVAHAMETSLDRVREGTHLPSKALIDSLFKSADFIESIIEKIKSKSLEQARGEEVQSIRQLLESAANELSPVSSMPTVDATCNGDAKKNSEGNGSIRVPVALLDNLMTLMGEMVLVRNQVLQFSGRSEDLEFVSMSKRLNVVTSEIQGEMMKTRMQPVGTVVGKFHRVVRDLANELGKKIKLNISGEETELDKSLLEAIKDPLTHIVRNSCDHGIEPADIRKSAGKSIEGRIDIKAYHEGGQVVIEVIDDGGGLRKQLILKKALEKGLVREDQAAKMSDKEIYQLIFAPGFSTATKVTSVSGRGVGMDVVRTNIERIGGTIDINSVAGAGTDFKIKIPLTLAIVPALIVGCGDGKFAIPQVHLDELVRVDQMHENKIEYLLGTPVYRLRGNVLPLVDLNSVLGIKKEADRGGDARVVNIAVLNADNHPFGLIIDKVFDTADIVVKPLNRLLKSLQVYSGATILGNGDVALILDVHGISKVSNLGLKKTSELSTSGESSEKTRSISDRQDFLLIRLNSPTKHAIPLTYVQRLEEFKSSQVEWSGKQPVIRYRDIILPIIRVGDQLGFEPLARDRELIPVVVIQRGGKLFGLEVSEILDTLSTALSLDTSLVSKPGLFGHLNTTDELVVVVDPFAIISTALPEFSPNKLNEQASPIALSAPPTVFSKHDSFDLTAPKKILLVEDTAFFRKSIKAVLESAGYEVLLASDGQDAMEMLSSVGEKIDLIVSDIEMPRMNGFQLAATIRQHPAYNKTPLLAISSRADDKYVNQGKKVGFDYYLEKLQPDVLLNAISNLVNHPRGAA